MFFRGWLFGPRSLEPRGNRIRTCGGTASPHFKCGALNRSAIPLPFPGRVLGDPGRVLGDPGRVLGDPGRVLGSLRTRPEDPGRVLGSLRTRPEDLGPRAQGGSSRTQVPPPHGPSGRLDPAPEADPRTRDGSLRTRDGRGSVSPKIRTWNDGSVDRSDGHFTKETRAKASGEGKAPKGPLPAFVPPSSASQFPRRRRPHGRGDDGRPPSRRPGAQDDGAPRARKAKARRASPSLPPTPRGPRREDGRPPSPRTQAAPRRDGPRISPWPPRTPRASGGRRPRREPRHDGLRHALSPLFPPAGGLPEALRAPSSSPSEASPEARPHTRRYPSRPGR